MSSVSLCMIVKNEEKILDRALASISAIADEIIIVDTGSTDNTVTIAQKYADIVHHFEWINDFSAARNYAQSLATKEYILRWDADWILRNSILAMQTLKNLKSRDFENADKVFFTWNLEFSEDNQPLRQQENYFFYRKDMFHWESPIHNELVSNKPWEKIKSITLREIEVDHYKDPEEKAWRYDMTRKIIEGELAKNPNDLKMLMCYTDALIFAQEYEEAIAYARQSLIHCNPDDTVNLIHCLEKLSSACLAHQQPNSALEILKVYEKKLQNNLRFILILADTLSPEHPSKAIENYKRYLEIQKDEAPEYTFDTDYLPERFSVHPHHMLGILYYKQKQYKRARPHLRYVVTHSLVPEKKKKLKPLYYITGVLQFFG